MMGDLRKDIGKIRGEIEENLGKKMQSRERKRIERKLEEEVVCIFHSMKISPFTSPNILLFYC